MSVPNWKDFFPFTRFWSPSESVATVILLAFALAVLVLKLFRI